VLPTRKVDLIDILALDVLGLLVCADDDLQVILQQLVDGLSDVPGISECDL